ncbi:unnamed protein product [Rotaria sp. Silwood2]|nr:unnamed protein product [Rotaria sp. Silwood2]
MQEATTSLFQHGGTLESAVSSRIVAQQLASELNRKLNYQKSEEEIQVTGNASKMFEEELEINDFPQNARSKVISKIDVQIQSLFNNSKKYMKAKGNALINPNAETSGSTSVNNAASKLELATKVAARLTLNKYETRDYMQEATTSLFQHDSTLKSAVSSRIVAQQLASELNRKLNYQKSEEEIQVTGNASKMFEEELEINDFPQNARSKNIFFCLSKYETLLHICECANVDILVRGQYYPNNKDDKQGNIKLYLQIKSLIERDLQLAKEEVARIIKEEMMKMQNPALQLGNCGRYKVLFKLFLFFYIL